MIYNSEMFSYVAQGYMANKRQSQNLDTDLPDS